MMERIEEDNKKLQASLIARYVTKFIYLRWLEMDSSFATTSLSKLEMIKVLLILMVQEQIFEKMILKRQLSQNKWWTIL